MLVRVAIYILATLFVFQTGTYWGEMSRPGQMTANEAATAFATRNSQVGTLEVPPCPEVKEIVLEEPCPSSRQGAQHYPRYGPACEVEHTLPHIHKSLAESTATQVFPLLHHKGSLVAAPGEIILTQSSSSWTQQSSSQSTKSANVDSSMITMQDSPCKEVYMTRTGSKQGMPNKCAAVVSVPPGSNSPYFQNIRRGISANMPDKFQNDYARQAFSYKIEKELLVPILNDIDKLKREFLRVMGEPIGPDGQRRIVTIMVVNSGVMDLLLNFMCSARAAKIDLSDTLVYVGQASDVKLIENLGLKAMYSNSLGNIPSNAAAHYADLTFARLMWLKVTSVYIANLAGFDVLFQDVDLTWIRDPFPFLRNIPDADIAFMDDGAKSPRFAPYFSNSGFYYVKYNERSRYLMEKMLKSICEIAFTHSHQATLMRHMVESHHVVPEGLRVLVLDLKDFPSGFMFHHNKDYIESLKSYESIPFVFHMCWTDSRVDKIKYFKEIGLWYLPEGKAECEKADKMSLMMNSLKKNSARSVMSECCMPSQYWANIPSEILEKIYSTNLTESLGLGVAGYVRSAKKGKKV